MLTLEIINAFFKVRSMSSRTRLCHIVLDYEMNPRNAEAGFLGQYKYASFPCCSVRLRSKLRLMGFARMFILNRH